MARGKGDEKKERVEEGIEWEKEEERREREKERDGEGEGVAEGGHIFRSENYLDASSDEKNSSIFKKVCC